MQRYHLVDARQGKDVSTAASAQDQPNSSVSTSSLNGISVAAGPRLIANGPTATTMISSVSGSHGGSVSYGLSSSTGTGISANDGEPAVGGREFSYRTLRPEEGQPGQPLRAKSSKSILPASVQQELLDHLLLGSNKGYESPFISTSADFMLALRFAGCLSRIAKIHLLPLKYRDLTPDSNREALEIPPGKQNECLKPLKFAARSQEILIYNEVPSSHYEVVNPKLSIARIESLPKNSARFVDMSSPFGFGDGVSVEQFLQLNMAMKKVSINSISSIFRAPRFNVDLAGIRKFDEALSAIVMEFLVLRFYRELGANVIDAQLVIGTLIVEKPSPYGYLMFPFDDKDKWGEAPVDQDAGIHGITEDFILDCLLGNWYVLGTNYRHIVQRGGTMFRTNAERSMGIYYPEEEEDKDKRAVPFQENAVLEIATMMERFSKQFKLKQDELGELISTFVDRKDQILKAIGSMSKLAAEFRKLGYLTEKHHKLVSYLQPRFEVLQDMLNFQVVPINSDPPHPCARDGHSSLLLGDELWVFGGNSSDGALNDLWRFKFKDNSWEKLLPDSNSLPSPRYSHTMTPWKSGFLIIAGCDRNHFLSDAHYFDISTSTWHLLPIQGLPPLTRHATCKVGLEVYVFGGHTKDRGKQVLSNALFRIKSDLLCERLNNCPVRRQRNCLFKIGTELWVVGGMGERSSEAHIYAFSLANRSWRKIQVTGPAVYRASNLVKVRTSDGRRKLVAVGGGNPSEDSRGEHFGGAIGAHEGGAVWSLTYSGDTDGADLMWKPEPLIGHSLAAVSSSQVYRRSDGLIYVFGGKHDDKWLNEDPLRTLRLGQSPSVVRNEVFSHLQQVEHLFLDLTGSQEELDRMKRLLKDVADLVSAAKR